MKKNLLIALLMCLMATSQLFAAVPTLVSGSGVMGTTKVAPSGTTITINGAGFTGTTIVTFGGVAVASFTIVSDIRIDAVVSSSGNSGYIYVQNPSGSVTSNYPFTYTPTTTNALLEGDVVINKVYNNDDTNGAGDAVELLVVKDNADLRGLYIKDFQPFKNGGGLTFFFREIPLFQHLRAGTLIVARNSATTIDGTISSPTDFNLDLGLKDLNYMNAGNASSALNFDIGNDDCMSLQKGASNFTGIMAMLGSGPTVYYLPQPPATNSSTNCSLHSGIYTRLNSSTTVTPGNFVYVTNRNSTIADYKHVGATAATPYVTADNAGRAITDANNDDSTPAALVLGTPNNATNSTYITNLRVIGSTVLPVNLISFTAKKGTNGIELNWATASEQNNNRFELQRSADGNSFVTIKTVTGANNANSRNNYSFLDKNPIAGVNYYKLVQIDNDGTVKELGVQAVSSDLKGLAFNVSSYGEVNQINYTVYATATGKANVTVFDLSGKEVANTTIDLSAGNNNLKINSNNLKSGVFVAVLKAENNTLTSKFIK
jgi:hypothetical protein